MNLNSTFALLTDVLAKGTVILLLAMVALLALRRTSAANRHALLASAFAVLLLLPLTKLATPRWAVGIDPKPNSTVVQVRLPALAPVEVATANEPSATVVNERRSFSNMRIPWRRLAIGVWAVGAVVLLVRRAVQGIRIAVLVRRSALATDERVRQFAGQTAGRIEIRESAQCPVPLATGVLRPVVLLPSSSCDWNDGLLCDVLRHEAGHIVRRDCLTRLIVDVVCALYWPNPFAWIAAKRLRLLQEHACDDLVLGSGTSAGEYAEHLVEVVRSLRGAPVPGNALAMAQQSTLETRVLAIVDESRSRSPLSLRAVVSGIAFAVAALTLCTAAQLRADEKKPGAAGDASPSGHQVLIEAKFIEIDGENPQVPEYLRPVGPAKVPSVRAVLPADKAEVGMKELTKVKGVDVLSTPRVTTRSKMQATIEIVREFRYPKDWKKNATGAWEPDPASFETKNVGVTFEVTPEVRAGDSILLHMVPQVVEFEGFVDLDAEPRKALGQPDATKRMSERLLASAAAAAPDGHRLQPIFRTRRMDTELTVWPGQTVVLGGLEDANASDAANVEGKKDGRRLMVFVTARIVVPDEDPAGQPAPEPGSGKSGSIKVESDEVTFDKTTGKMRASGNVKVETATAVITAPEIEVTPTEGAAKKPELQPAAKLVIPQVEFRGATLPEVVDFLVQRSKALDPEKKGVNILLREREKLGGTKITLSLSNVSIAEVLRFAGTLANCEVAEEPFAFIVRRAEAAKPEAVATRTSRTDEVVLEKTHGNITANVSSTFSVAQALPMKKAGSIIFPKVDLRDSTITEAVDFLRERSKALDPEKKGVNLVVVPVVGKPEAKITLSLANIPLSEAVRYIAALADYLVVEEQNALVLKPVAK